MISLEKVFDESRCPFYSFVLIKRLNADISVFFLSLTSKCWYSKSREILKHYGQNIDDNTLKGNKLWNIYV